MRNRRIVAFLAALSMFVGFAYAAAPAMAITIVPECATKVSVDPPSLQCVEQVFLNIASLVIAISGSFALLMFVYGGFMMIVSQGNQDKIKQGKTIITNAVIGILLIFLGGYVIDYIRVGLTQGRSIHAVGEKCNDGRGAYVSTKAGPVCQTPCAQVRDVGYECMDAQEGRDCNPNYVGCGGGLSCCIGLTGEELDAMEAEKAASQ